MSALLEMWPLYVGLALGWTAASLVVTRARYRAAHPPIVRRLHELRDLVLTWRDLRELARNDALPLAVWLANVTYEVESRRGRRILRILAERYPLA